MQLRKRVVIPVLCAVLIIGLGVNYVKKQEPKDILVEEEIADLPQKPSVSLDAYVPVIKDTIWTYESKEKYKSLSNWVEFINDDVMQIKIASGDKSYTKVYVEEEDAIYEVASIEDEAIKENHTTLRQYKNTILKLPLIVGNSWVLSDGAIRTITQVDKNYDTPLGKQKGIEITTLHDDYKVIEVYAEKVGLIYVKYETDNSVEEFELDKIENNTAQEEKLALYIAKKDTGALERVEEKVAIMTNEEPKHFLTDMLKKVVGSEFITTLSNSVTIEKIFKDDENCLYVELSGEFIDVNYNAREQKGVLMSLVQTLGRYYNADYVVLNIEGEAYPIKGGQADSKGRIRVVK